MVFKKSEYKREYRQPVWDSHFYHYREKVDFRTNRRAIENSHQAFDWDDSDSDSEGSRPGAYRARGRRGPQPAPASAPPPAAATPVTEDRQVQTPRDWSSPEVDIWEKPPAKSRRPRPRKSLARKTRTLSSSGRVGPQQGGAAGPAAGAAAPPFLAFGMGCGERLTGAKRTHNVRVPTADPLQVYPAALRAQRRRQAEVGRQQQALQRASLAEKRRLALFNQLAEPSSVWQTEYQRNFAGTAAIRQQLGLPNAL